MDSTSPVIVERRDHVAIVWLDRPDKRNAFAPAFWTSFPTVIEELGDDPEIRAVVVAAKGAAFTVGIDLKAFGPALVTGNIDLTAPAPASPVAQRAQTRRLVKTMQRTFSSLAECPKPVIAAIHGYCIGAGVDLITACDIRYAAVDAIFSIRETRLAMVADVGTLQRLPKIIDPGSVAELAYTGRDFDAGEAASLGLITRILADADAVVAAAIETAEAIAANSPLAVQGTKAVLRAGDGRTVDEALDYVALWNAAFLHSNDLGEAMASFVEKRDPEFKGL
ncbi:MAG: crotonase/enoyl-CoA hydratase family protein [Actinomycetia bacterium]|nr:crotonase/enoyl-CoA hydratase family protein [Actinomycetes bacterium]